MLPLFQLALVVEGDNSFESGLAAAEKLLAMKDRPTAIFAANDDMAVAVIHVADRLGIEIPAELSVAGFDDIALARQVFPSLTTIRQPLSQMSELAAQYLIEGKCGEDIEKGADVIPASIIYRDSTGPAPA